MSRARWLGVLGRLGRARGGATAIEMAFILPVFLLFLIGIEEFGRAIWTQTALQYASEVAARCAAVSPALCTPTVPDYAASHAFGLGIPANAFTFSPNAFCGAVSSGSSAQVTASYQFKSVAGGLIPKLASITLTAKSCHP